MRRVVIFGATSAIAEATARIFAGRGDRICLVGRRPDRLEEIATDLRVRGAAQAEVLVADLAETEGHRKLVEIAEEKLGGLDTALVAHGSLGDQKACEADWACAQEEIRVNFLSAASLLEAIAARFETARSGTIAVISSVAGDRGRQSNYVYGASKAALSAWASGLRNRLAPAGVHVVTIKPGFVDTPMTAHVPKGPLFASPEQVAKGIDRAIVRKRDVVYLPWFWAPIMAIVRAIPEGIFKRLKL